MVRDERRCYVEARAGAPVFALGGFRDPLVPVAAAWFSLVMNVVYVALVPIQAFVGRGAVQGPLARCTLVAPVVSHALVGWRALFMLGFDRLLV